MWESIVVGFKMLFSKKGSSDKGYIDNEIELRFNRLEELR